LNYKLRTDVLTNPFNLLASQLPWIQIIDRLTDDESSRFHLAVVILFVPIGTSSEQLWHFGIRRSHSTASLCNKITIVYRPRVGFVGTSVQVGDCAIDFSPERKEVRGIPGTVVSTGVICSHCETSRQLSSQGRSSLSYGNVQQYSYMACMPTFLTSRFQIVGKSIESPCRPPLCPGLSRWITAYRSEFDKDFGNRLCLLFSKKSFRPLRKTIDARQYIDMTSVRLKMRINQVDVPPLARRSCQDGFQSALPTEFVAMVRTAFWT